MLAFVMGLPHDVAAQISATPRVEGMEMPSVLAMARALMSGYRMRADVSSAAAAAATSEEKARKPSAKFCPQSGAKEKICFRCRKPGHFARFCKEPLQAVNDEES